MDISRFFIDRPRFAAVLSIVIFLAGLLAMFRLPLSEYPEVAPPAGGRSCPSLRPTWRPEPSRYAAGAVSSRGAGRA